MSKRYIGMFDILGFKELIESSALATVVDRSRRFVSLADGVRSISAAVGKVPGNWGA
jgi:hypothetical protein